MSTSYWVFVVFKDSGKSAKITVTCFMSREPKRKIMHFPIINNAVKLSKKLFNTEMIAPGLSKSKNNNYYIIS